MASDSPRSVKVTAAANAINRLHHEYYGRGGSKARTVMERNFVVVFLDDIYNAAERTLIDADRRDLVRENRQAFQDTMTERFSAAIEEVVGRKVIAFMSQVHFDPDMAAEVFVLEPNGGDTTSDAEHAAAS